MRFSCPSRQRGVALITALLIVALAALLASGMLARQNLSIHRSGNLFAQEQAWWYAIGAENWAAKILERDRRDNQTDHLQENWATAIDFLPVEGGVLTGKLIDQQGLFNLNNLAGNSEEEAAKQLQRLLPLVGIDPFGAPALAKAILDWIDEGVESDSPDAAEDDYYLSLRDMPYRAANQPITSITELRLIKGVKPEDYLALAPFITALPDNTPINVNTAPKEVLAALVPNMTLEEAAQIEARREAQPFKDRQEFLSQEILAGRQINADLIGVESEYFLLDVLATVGTTRVKLYSLLRRDTGGRVQTARRSRDQS